ncbi:enoyl-CoA-hydratase DpgB [Streptomyces sp. NPDC058231]|uniref:enoyl-CoA-hydratase DpgB n=1 Tax=unclassified Streptomyces TaxID=2593676 RepID=UPI0036ED85C4
MTTSSGIPERVDPELVLRIDGSRPLTAALVAETNALCARVEDGDASGVAVLRLSGAPDALWIHDLAVPLVNKWERALRRLERLDVATIGVADGDCGGTALEALLATDYRIATGTVRLLLPGDAGGVWPGMALYRMANQIGVGAARRTVLRGLPVPARQALELQLVDEVVDDPETGLAEAAELVGAASGGGIAMRRQLMLDASTTSFEDALGSHLAACDRVLRRVPVGSAS